MGFIDDDQVRRGKHIKHAGDALDRAIGDAAPGILATQAGADDCRLQVAVSGIGRSVLLHELLHMRQHPSLTAHKPLTLAQGGDDQRLTGAGSQLQNRIVALSQC